MKRRSEQAGGVGAESARVAEKMRNKEESSATGVKERTRGEEMGNRVREREKNERAPAKRVRACVPRKMCKSRPQAHPRARALCFIMQAREGEENRVERGQFFINLISLAGARALEKTPTLLVRLESRESNLLNRPLVYHRLPGYASVAPKDINPGKCSGHERARTV